VEIQFIEKEGVVVATVSGRMDALTAPDFEKGMAVCLTEGGRLVLDFSGLEYISSAGLRVLVALAQGVKATDGAIAFCGATGLVKKVFGIFGFQNLVPVYDTVHEACGSVSSGKRTNEIAGRPIA
jgi:anti-anti-sigma factor